MTKDIILTISGLYSTEGETDDPIEIISPGQYFFRNGKHYVIFDEVIEGIDGVVKSTLKFNEKQAELIRSGAASTRMVFESGQEHSMIYQTSMGPLSFSVCTDDVNAEFSEEEMNLEINYSLKAEGVVITENTVHLNVCPKELKTFEI